MRRFLLLVLALTLLAGWSTAQSANRGELFGGYSYIAEDFSLTHSSSGGLNGWNASGTFKAFRNLGFVGDFAGYYPSFNEGCAGQYCSQSAKIHTFLFGPQVSATSGRLMPFVRFLFGDTNLHSSIAGGVSNATFTSTNSLTYGAGGGVDVRLTDRFAARGQVDWLHNGFQTSDDQRTSAERHNVVRVSTGIVFRF